MPAFPAPPKKFLSTTVVRGNQTVHTQVLLDVLGLVPVKAILDSVNIRLYQKDEIWIRKKGALVCRPRPYQFVSLLNERDHNDCVIFVGPDPPAPLPQSVLPLPFYTGPILTPTPSAAPPDPPQKRIRKIPRSVIERQKALLRLRRRKILAQKNQKPSD